MAMACYFSMRKEVASATATTEGDDDDLNIAVDEQVTPAQVRYTTPLRLNTSKATSAAWQYAGH